MASGIGWRRWAAIVPPYPHHPLRRAAGRGVLRLGRGAGVVAVAVLLAPVTVIAAVAFWYGWWRGVPARRVGTGPSGACPWSLAWLIAVAAWPARLATGARAGRGTAGGAVPRGARLTGYPAGAGPGTTGSGWPRRRTGRWRPCGSSPGTGTSPPRRSRPRPGDTARDRGRRARLGLPAAGSASGPAGSPGIGRRVRQEAVAAPGAGRPRANRRARVAAAAFPPRRRGDRGHHQGSGARSPASTWASTGGPGDPV